ncbi:MAG TPA: hypothetical protein VIL74_08935 [Pyrinomonadaceae bacterium]|jgi:hypothetical protein
MDTIVEEIKQERTRQDEQWGGAKHDDEHYPVEFTRFVQEQIDKTWRCPENIENIRERFIKIAALAVAAVESIDRKRQPRFQAAADGTFPLPVQNTAVSK